MKSPIVLIDHILDSIESITKYSKGIGKRSFLTDPQLQDSIIRRIEIIGEATKSLPASIKQMYPLVPWKAIGGMRDKLVHEYFSVDLELTWNVENEIFPPIKMHC